MSDDGNSYRTQFPDPDWHAIAERAAKETDPKKLALLVKALCDRLDQVKQQRFSENKAHGADSGDSTPPAKPF